MTEISAPSKGHEESESILGHFVSCPSCGYFNTTESTVCFDCGILLHPETPKSIAETTNLSTPPALTHPSLPFNLNIKNPIVLAAIILIVATISYNIPALIGAGAPAAVLLVAVLFALTSGFKPFRDFYLRLATIIVSRYTESKTKALNSSARDGVPGRITSGEKVTLSWDAEESSSPTGVLRMAELHAEAGRVSAGESLDRISELLAQSDLDEIEREALNASKTAALSYLEKAHIALVEVAFTRWQNYVRGTLARIQQIDFDSPISTVSEQGILTNLEARGKDIKGAATELSKIGVCSSKVIERANAVLKATDSLLTSIKKGSKLIRRVEIVRAVRQTNVAVAHGTTLLNLGAEQTVEEREAAAIAIDLATTDFYDTELLVERWKLEGLTWIDGEVEEAQQIH